MLDNQIIAIVIATIIAGEATAGIPGTPIKQAFQPTQQGVDTAPTAYIHKLGDHRYGYPLYSDIWDEVHSKMVHTESQQYETSFQISALSTQDPANTAQYTASDILNFIASILQSASVVASLQTQDLGILRISDVRNIPFIDDRDRNEYAPSLDFVIQHKQTIISEVPIVNIMEIGLYPI